MMKLSDYVADKVVELGTRHVFMITGGGAMHLNQSLGSHNKLECIFNHHEQASAMAAESYYRINNRPALVNVTSGPGGTNAITGVHGAWTDSIGMVVISGQVKVQTTVRSSGIPLRQLGDQEVDIEPIVSSITKYSVMVTEAETIRYHIEKAFYLALNGRPGPCWIDIPIDIQGAQIEVDQLRGFDPEELHQNEPVSDQKYITDLEKASSEILERIRNAKRPLIFAGGGVRLSGAHKSFIDLVEQLAIPVVTGWNAHDAIWNQHPYYIGRPGTVGDRAGNFSLQNADLLVILGSRLNIRQVSYNWDTFASNAYKIWVDIDPLELEKPTVKPDLPIVADLKELLPLLIDHASVVMEGKNLLHQEWLSWCRDRAERYPVVLQEYWESEQINPYCFIDALFKKLPENEVIVTANGTACVTGFQAANLKAGQRLWTNSGCASMGYDLPAAIGACIGNQREQVICLAGDGSIMMNLQELQTIVSNKLPIKIFVLNNAGYISIRQTHNNFFNGNEVGAGEASGVIFPDFKKLSAGFGIPYVRCTDYQQMEAAIKDTLEQQGAVLCEVILDLEYQFAPKLASRQLEDGLMVSPSLEDMAPFLSEEELHDNRVE